MDVIFRPQSEKVGVNIFLNKASMVGVSSTENMIYLIFEQDLIEDLAY